VLITFTEQEKYVEGSDSLYVLNTIWVYGVGGVGGYFGGKLAYSIERNHETDKRVFFIARGEHLDAIKQDGLILNTAEQDGVRCIPYQATDKIEIVPDPDLCLLCVKSYDLDSTVRSLAGKVKDKTIVIPLLNGIDIHERVRTILKAGIVLPACAYVGTHIEKPGTVTQKGAPGIILCGKDPAFKNFNHDPLITLFTGAKIKINWVDDPFPAIWEKFIFIAAFGLVTAYSEKTLGEVAADPELQGLVEKIMDEIVAIAGKKGISLPAGIVEASIGKANNFPFETKTSYQRDIETKGKRNEGDLFGGTIIRMGKAFGVLTPTTLRIYESIDLKLKR
jgi:2-dehydropantoate 2-reductase